MAEADPVIDVERLVAELKERVERKRAEGAYTEPFAHGSTELVPVPASRPPPPVGQSDGARRPAPRISFVPGDRYRSPRRVVGAVISSLRRIVLRLVHPALDDVARQADSAVAALHARLEWAEEAIAAEAKAREGAQFLAEHVERRVDDLSRFQGEAVADVGLGHDTLRAEQEELRARLGLLEDDLRQLEDELAGRQEELRGQQVDLRKRDDELRGQQVDLRERHDELREGQDDLRQRHDDLRERHDALREGQDELRERYDELRERYDELRERHDDLRQRQGERLDRLETSTRAFQTSSNQTIQGMSDHLRGLEARVREPVAAPLEGDAEAR